MHEHYYPYPYEPPMKPDDVGPGPEGGPAPVPGWTYPPVDRPAPPPGPPVPGQVPPRPFPPLVDIPPVPSVKEGQSLYEALNIQAQRTNACIQQWNNIARNCFEAMNACVEAARSNDVYYDEREVHYQTGYDENEGCAYAIIEKRVVDRQKRPIHVRLVPAYDNSTNSGVTQSIFDVSFIKSANVIITAVPTAQKSWNGPAMWRGAPVPGTENPEGYVYGFNKFGWLRVFKAQDLTETTLAQNGMVDAVGGCWPVIQDGQLTADAEGLTGKASITALGFNKGTGSVFFFSCSNQDQPGMSGVAVAKVLQGFGCDTAVITSMVLNTEVETVPAGGMLYMGQMCSVPAKAATPENLAFWVISKREVKGPGFKNHFQKEIADLVQLTGQNNWKNYLLGVQIQSFDDRIADNARNLQQEIERATEAERQLQENIDAERERAEGAEAALDQKIEDETDRAENREAELDQKIEDETTRATNAEQELNNKLVQETARATAAEGQLATDIQSEKLRAMTRENEIQEALDSEIRARIAADNDIINAIEQEVLARRAADTALENKVDAVKQELQITIQQVKNQVDGLTSGQTELPYLKLTGGTLTGSLTISGTDTVTVGRGPTTDMEVATKKYVDDAVQTGGGGGTGGDVSKEYVDQQVGNLQTQISGKVDKAGDTMTGALTMDKNQIIGAVLVDADGVRVEDGSGGPGTVTNLRDPVEDTEAVPKSYLEQQIADAKQEIAGDYLPLAGGEMTGDIEMLESAVVNFYDPVAMTADLQKGVLTKSSTALAIKPSAAAKRLGITAELIADAMQKGIEVTQETTGAELFSAIGVAAREISGYVLRGSVYNDDEEMVVKSESGAVRLEGTQVNLDDGQGQDIGIRGAKGIGPSGQEVLNFEGGKVDVIGPVNVSNVPGDAKGTLTAGTVKASGTVSAGTVSGVTVSASFDVLGPAIGTGLLKVGDYQGTSKVTHIRHDTDENTVIENYKTENDTSFLEILTPGTGPEQRAVIRHLGDGVQDDDAATVGQIKNSGEIWVDSQKSIATQFTLAYNERKTVNLGPWSIGLSHLNSSQTTSSTVGLNGHYSPRHIYLIINATVALRSGVSILYNYGTAPLAYFSEPGRGTLNNSMMGIYSGSALIPSSLMQSTTYAALVILL